MGYAPAWAPVFGQHVHKIRPSTLGQGTLRRPSVERALSWAIMQCPSCGHSVVDDESHFCSICGSELAPSAPTSDPIAAIDTAVDAFEEGELQNALDVLDEELDRAEGARDEITLIYLLDVSRQMLAQLDQGQFDGLEQFVADAEDALHACQEGALPATLSLQESVSVRAIIRRH